MWHTAHLLQSRAQVLSTLTAPLRPGAREEVSHLRPCKECGKPTRSTRCEAHTIERDRHLKPKVADILIARDGLGCYRCGDLITTLTGRRPGSLSVDHIVDVLDGGSDALENLRLSHYGCNSGAAGGMAPNKSRSF